VPALGQVVLEARQVEPEPGRVTPQGLVVEVFLVREEEVVHLPEASLGGGRLGGLGGAAGVRVHRVERKVPEHEAQPIAHLRSQLLHHRVHPPAVGAL
jgi:hypothetical protein